MWSYQTVHTPLVALVSVDVVAELDADLSLCRLVFDEAVSQQLLCVGSLGVVLEQTRLHKVLQLL